MTLAGLFVSGIITLSTADRHHTVKELDHMLIRFDIIVRGDACAPYSYGGFVFAYCNFREECKYIGFRSGWKKRKSGLSGARVSWPLGRIGSSEFLKFRPVQISVLPF